VADWIYDRDEKMMRNGVDGMDCRTLRRHRLIAATAVAFLVGAATVFTSCGDGTARADRQGGLVAGSAEEPDVLATIGDEEVTLADLRQHAGSDLDQIEIQYRRARSQVIQNALEQVVRERILEGEARRQNQSVAQLIAAEAGGTLEPSDVEIQVWYQDNAQRVGGRSLDEVRPQIANLLRDEKSQAATQALEQRLRQEREVVVHYEPFRFQLNNDGSPYLGGSNALVTLVEYSDFECPFCARFATTLKQLNAAFGDDLKIVYRQFPITSIHPNAFKAAEGSLCAHDQGKFWEMHDAMFFQQNRLAVSDIKALARQLGLDQRRFDQCLDSGRYTEQVQNDMREAQAVGVTGTPALFINGVPLQGGAQPYEVVAEAIQQELDRVRR
jgi:protein-disulfide isomerase